MRILSGPFRDHLGLCSGMTGRERVLVLLNVLGAQRQRGLRDDAVEPIDGGSPPEAQPAARWQGSGGR